MLLKLFIAMGLTWMLEIIAFAVSQSTEDGDVPQLISILLTIPNVFQGIIIFSGLFGIKASNRNHIKKKYFGKKLSSTNQSSTKMSFYGESSGTSFNRQNSTPILKKSVSYSPCNDKDAVEFLPSSNIEEK